MLKQYFRKLLNFAVKKSHYKKMIIFYSAFTVFTISFSSFFLLSHFNNSLKNEAKISNQRLLIQLRIYSDTLLRESIYSMLNEKFLDLYRDKNILDFFSINQLNNSEVSARLYDDLSIISTSSSNSIIDSIYVYRISDKTLISSREGICASISSAEAARRMNINFISIEQMVSSPASWKWISPLENEEFWPDKPIISFIQAVPLIAHANKIVGYVVVNINETRFFESINNISDTNMGQFLITDVEGRIFSNSNRKEVFGTTDLNGYLKEALVENDGFIVAPIDGKHYGITWTESVLNDWKYISITHIDIINRELFLTKQFAVVLIIFTVLFALLGLRIITLSLYKPIRILFRSAVEKFDIQSGNDNELMVIDKVMKNLSNRVEEMSSTIKENQGIIIHRTVMDIINGSISEQDELDERLNTVNADMTGSLFCMMITEMDKYSFNFLSPKQKEYIIYKIIEIIDCNLNEISKCLSISPNSKCVATIINFKSREDISANIPSIIHTIRSYTGIDCNIVLSDPTGTIFDLSSYYERGQKILRYAFIYNYGNIITHKEIECLEKEDRQFDLSQLDSIAILIKSCKFTAAREHVEKFFIKLRNGRYTFEHVQNTLVQLISLFCRVIKEQNIDNDISKKNTFSQFNRISSLDECKQWVLKLIDLYEKYIVNRNKSINTDFIDKIQLHICDNIENLLSLSSVAEAFGISPNYLSKIFKEGSGINFSEFLVQKKLEKAKELLLTDKKAAVMEIAKRLGYYNTNYFISLFKEYYGMTPSMLRKRNLH